MAIKTVKFTLNGQTVELTFDSPSGSYKGVVTAPGATSWAQNSDHKYHGVVVAEDDAGNKVTASVPSSARWASGSWRGPSPPSR